MSEQYSRLNGAHFLSLSSSCLKSELSWKASLWRDSSALASLKARSPSSIVGFPGVRGEGSSFRSCVECELEGRDTMEKELSDLRVSSSGCSEDSEMAFAFLRKRNLGKFMGVYCFGSRAKMCSCKAPDDCEERVCACE